MAPEADKTKAEAWLLLAATVAWEKQRSPQQPEAATETNRALEENLIE
jgi:hypothetical protein